MATLNEIETFTKTYAFARKELAVRVQELEDEIAQLKKRHMNGIKKAVEVAKTYQSRVYAAIDESPELFVKPRSLILFGIRVGYMKQKGKIEWEDDEFVIERLKKLFPDTWKDYVKITEKPVKSMLETLSVAELKKIGVTAEESGDKVIIRPTDSDVERLVERLLSEELQEVKKVA